MVLTAEESLEATWGALSDALPGSDIARTPSSGQVSHTAVRTGPAPLSAECLSQDCGFSS